MKHLLIIFLLATVYVRLYYHIYEYEDHSIHKICIIQEVKMRLNDCGYVRVDY